MTTIEPSSSTGPGPSLPRSSRTSALAFIANGAPDSSSPFETGLAAPAPLMQSSRSHSPSNSRQLQFPFLGRSISNGPSGTGSAGGSGASTPASPPLLPIPPLSFASLDSTTKDKAGFVVTSRPKHYNPPPAPSSGGSSTPRQLSSPLLPHNIPLPVTPLPLPSPALSSTASFLSSSPSAVAFPVASTSTAHLSHHPSTSSTTSSPLRSRRNSPPAPLTYPSSTTTTKTDNGAKTTLTLKSSLDAKGRRMVNQYVRLKTIGQGSHGKVWLCAEPTSLANLREEDDLEEDSGSAIEEDKTSSSRRRRVEGEEDLGEVEYCAIKSVARDGPGRGKSLRGAKARKVAEANSTGAGIGQDDKVKREVAIMKRLDHRNVVRLKEVIDDVKSKKVFMVLEFMAGGQIEWQDDNKRPTMTVDEARRTFRDVVLGLEYLHHQGIVHRDIKPANLLWTEDHSIVKISDFGVSHVSDALQRATPDGTYGDDDRALRKTAGSPAFFAPELCHPAEYSLTTPTPHPEKHEDEDDYFSSSNSPPFSSSTGTSPIIRRTSTIISAPLPTPDPSLPRTRPPIGKAIDIWALGVTLYCLLFGDTPFMAKTEYELYNMIVKDGVRVPEKMGKEGAWTGVGKGWEGCGDGVEGREIVALLGGLLQKDPAKRIKLEAVKQHPWVLRGLSSSPDSWLCDTDILKHNTVIITDEDVEKATQERGLVDSLPQIRNRPGLRRALNAALVRFPAFSRLAQSHHSRTQKDTTSATSGNRSRSKSASSTSQSVVGDGSNEGYWGGTGEKISRHPSDATAASSTSRKKTSAEFGVDIRRIISGGRDSSPSRAAPVQINPAPAIGGSRGGWGARHAAQQQKELREAAAATAVTSPSTNSSSTSTPTNTFPELSRSQSASSIGNNTGTSRRRHLFPSRKNSDRDSRASSISARSTESPATASDTESTGRRKISQLISRLGGSGGSSSNGRSTPRQSLDRKGSVSDDESIPESLQEAVSPSTPIVVESLPTESYNPRPTRSAFDILSGYDDEEIIEDTSEYSSDDDYDELAEPPISKADGIEGWQSTFVGVRGEDFANPDGDIMEEEDDLKPPYPLDDSTPRAAPPVRVPVNGLDLHLVQDSPIPSAIPPPLVRQSSSDSPSARTLRNSGSSTRDGSIRNGVEGVIGGRKWMVYHDENPAFDDAEEEEEEEDGMEIFVAPRRKRATTLVD